MQTVPLQLSDVTYNAATQSFEALVTVHEPSGARSYACAIEAPITMEFAEAADGLATQALRRHVRGRSDAKHLPVAMTPRRQNRLAGLRRMTIDTFAALRPRAA